MQQFMVLYYANEYKIRRQQLMIRFEMKRLYGNQTLLIMNSSHCFAACNMKKLLLIKGPKTR
jgi:hypothetical protein